MKKTAILSDDRLYRYLLSRQWGNDVNNFVNFVLLNPSTADENNDDPTLRSCIRIAQNLGFDGLYITNLFAFRTKSPEILKRSKDPVGPENEKYLKECFQKAKLVILAWGNHGCFLGRDKEVLKIVDKLIEPYCLAVTKLGSPKHPLYVRSSVRPFESKD